MGYLILWLQWQGAPSHVAKDYLLLLGTFGDHMQKFGPKSQNLSEISGFENIVSLRFPITLTLEK